MKKTPAPNGSEMSFAIWHPIFRDSIPKRAIAVSFFLLLIFCLVLPSTSNSNLQNWFQKLADVRLQASLSHMPFVVAVAYGSSLLMAPVAAFIACFSALDVFSFQKFIRAKGATSRFIFTIGIFVFLTLPYFQELPVSDTQFSFNLFHAVRVNRLALFMWCEGVFLLHVVFWFWIAAEITNFFNYFKGNKK